MLKLCVSYVILCRKKLKFDSYAKDIINDAKLVERFNISLKKRVGKKRYQRPGKMIKL